MLYLKTITHCPSAPMLWCAKLLRLGRQPLAGTFIIFITIILIIVIFIIVIVIMVITLIVIVNLILFMTIITFIPLTGQAAPGGCLFHQYRRLHCHCYSRHHLHHHQHNFHHYGLQVALGKVRP